MSETCQRCSSTRLVWVNAPAKDLFSVDVQKPDGSINEYEGYLPEDLGIGDYGDLVIVYCLQCGQIQGDWDLPRAELEDTADVAGNNVEYKTLAVEQNTGVRNGDVVAVPSEKICLTVNCHDPAILLYLKEVEYAIVPDKKHLQTYIAMGYDVTEVDLEWSFT